MRKYYFLSTLVLTIFFYGNTIYSQDFSNKGKDFWVGYGYHQVMNGTNAQEMVLYFAADTTNTNVTVTIPGIGYTQSYFVAANTVLTSNTIPKAGGQDARLRQESTTPENKGIHITSDKPIVAYAHIYNQSVSGASILFPTNTLGREYYSINYTNISNTNNSNCWFYVVAADTGTTTVEITPSAATINRPAGVPFTVNLTQGQVYNIMGEYSGNSGVDLTGSKIQSINTGAGCKRIGVFSGSGRISITCTGSSSSSDNYMVQAFPKSAWGKKYLTVSTGGNQSNNIYRVCVSDPSTVVTLNGGPIGVPLQNGFYYELPVSTTPKRIEADKPIMVSQYLTSQNACGNGQPGDPEVIYLSPVEQNISKVLWNATPNFSILQHYFNVVIPNTGTAITSFRLDGVPVAPGLFVPHPQDPGYSYLVQSVTSGQHTIQSDTGFNAIAYGYGNAESYGYNAGTNIKDIFQYISVQNEFGTVNFPATCRNSPFYFSMTFPYQPTQIKWQFGAALNAMGIIDVTLSNGGLPIPPTSTTVVAGKTLYIYQLPLSYTITSIGTYPIRVVATNPTPDGCGGTQEIDFDVQVFNPPLADFNFTTTGCVTSPVQFTDNSNTSGRAVISRHWNFADATTSSINNPTHTFAAPGSYNVKYTLITDIGCIADTASHLVTLNELPTANFNVVAPNCVNRAIRFNDLSSPSGNATLSQWTWDFGDGTPVQVYTVSTNPTHVYTNPGSYTVTLRVQTTSGCSSILFSQPVTIHPNPVADFTLPNVCLPAGAAQFNDLSTVTGGGSVNAWSWSFGDAGTSTVQHPLHNYSSTGPFNVRLIAFSNNGCRDTSDKVLNTVYAEPQAAFNWPSGVCLGSSASFTDNSVAQGSTVTQWSWNFGDGNVSTLRNPTHTYASAGTYTVRLNVTSAIGCQTVNNFATHQVIVKALPTASISGTTIVCLNSTLPNVTFTGASGIPPYTFTYKINGGADQTVTTTSGNSVTVPVPTGIAGTFIYTLVKVKEGSTTLCEQLQTGSATVTVKVLPTANITGTTSVCLNATSPALTFTGANGTAPYTFTYKINGGADQTVTTTSGNSITVAVPTNNTGVFTYTLVSVKESSSNLCMQVQTGSAVVTVTQLPTATVSGSNEVCLNASPPLVTFTGASGTAPYTFTYNINGGPNQNITTTSGNSVTVQVPTGNAGTFIYSLISIKDGSSTLCSQLQSGSVSIIVNPLPASNFNFSVPLCETRTISFTDISIANAGALNSWQWNFSDPGSGAANTSAFQNPVHVFATAGTYDVSLITTSDKGCVSTPFSKQVIINSRPKAGFISPEICLTDPSAPFSDTSKIANGNIASWDWNFGDPNATLTNPNISTLQNPNHRYIVVGSYTSQLIVTSNNGCKDTIKQTFTVNGSIPVSDFNIQNATILCSNKDVNITDASTVDFGNLVKVEIYWDYLNNPTIKTTDDLPVSGKIYTHTYPEFSGPPYSKTYRVRYIGYSGINCINTKDKDITVFATPSLQFNPIPFACSDAPSFQVTQTQLLNGLPGSGTFTGPGITSTGVFTPSLAGIGMNTIRYTYVGSNGCTNFKEQTINIYQTPPVNAGPDKVVLEGGQVTLTPALNIGQPVTYLWTPPAGLIDPTIAFAVASPTEDITYTLTVTTEMGCTNNDRVFVKVLKAPTIPNIFSPNGDGVHDKWVLQYLESYPGCTVDIYNRYGQLIYHSVGYSTPWDGTINGKPVPIGTYYYIVNPKNGRKQISGYVDVIR